MVRQITYIANFVLIAYPAVVLAITTIHHDKPEEARISEMATKMKQTQRTVPLNLTRMNSERQKRLLPYINYYLDHNHQKQINNFNYQIVNRPKNSGVANYNIEQNTKFTPFLESNALPGPFIPITKFPQKNINVEYVSEPPTETERTPNYSGIYEKLAQLKLAQQINKPPYIQSYNTDPTYRKPQIKYVPVHHYPQEQYKSTQPAKTVIETYTPTNIEIPEENVKNYESQRVPVKINNANLLYKIYNQKPQYIEVTPSQQEYPSQDYEVPITSPKPYIVQKQVLRNPIIYTIRTKPKQVNTIIDDKYVAQKYIPIIPSHENIQNKPLSPVQFVPEQYEVTHEDQEYYQTPAPITQHVTTENTNSLQLILKQLQESNTLPHTLTAENIDNSIKTLVKILNTLKKKQKLISKPIVVAEENSEEIHGEDDEQIIEEPQHIPGTVTQSFPANTVEGGTPGRPGIDYPALSSIPPTTFNCKTQRYKGFFGDPNTHCQVWHYCDLNGGQASFLCPNGTIFSQVALTCDWWYNVKCSSTTQLYVLNERLYKYILPLSPKFPEDYSGPLVDKYLALKFKEMEEKMSKEKKKEDKSEEKDDSDQLQDIQNEKNAKSSEET